MLETFSNILFQNAVFIVVNLCAQLYLLLGEFRINLYSLLYLKQIANKDLLYSRGNSAPRCVAAWMGVVHGRMDTCVCIAESIALHLKLSQHC